MQFKTKTAPATEPVTLAEAKAHLRVDHSDEDDQIEALIQSAREWVEDHIERPIITQTITGATDRFSRRMELKPNLQSITAIRYIDTDGAEQTLDASVYALDDYALIGAVYLAPNQEWPSTRGEPFDVQVDFVAGYGEAADVPAKIKQAILLLIGHLYANREATTISGVEEMPLSVDSLLSSARVVPV